MQVSTRRIAIVGTGAVAQALGRLLYLRSEAVVALASRNQARAQAAALFVGPGVRAVACSDLPSLADHVLVAVRDEGIAVVADELARAGMQHGVALHTCGARGPEALSSLRKTGVACGVLHPLQTVVTPQQGVESLVSVTWGVAGDAPAVAWAEEIVARVDGRAVRVTPERLSAYHAGAVMASNAIVATIDAAVTLLEQAGIERSAALRAIEPIARTSLGNIFASGPVAALTGPVVRGDARTVAMHMDALRQAPPTVAALYEAAARHLLEIARRRGLPDREILELEAVLDGQRMKGSADKIREKVG